MREEGKQCPGAGTSLAWSPAGSPAVLGWQVEHEVWARMAGGGFVGWGNMGVLRK